MSEQTPADGRIGFESRTSRWRSVPISVGVIAALAFPAVTAACLAIHFGVLSITGAGSIALVLAAYAKLAFFPGRRTPMSPPLAVRDSIGLASSEVERTPLRYGPNSEQVALFLDRLPFLSDEEWKHVDYVWRHLAGRPIVHVARIIRHGLADDAWTVVDLHRRLSAEAALRDALSLDIAMKHVAPFTTSAIAVVATKTAATALLYRDLLEAKDFDHYYGPFAEIIPLVDR